jgi:hypothetical protein
LNVVGITIENLRRSGVSIEEWQKLQRLEPDELCVSAEP